MYAYYDTGVLLPFYVQEVFSEAVLALANSRHETIPFNLFQQLEMETAIRLKHFRGEIDSTRLHAVIADRDADIRNGRLLLCPVNWVNALEEARRLGALATARCGCRTLDLVHVAIAMQWQCDVFVTADNRQLKAARSAGLATVDVRAFGRGDESGETGAPVRTVREKHARYRSKMKHTAPQVR